MPSKIPKRELRNNLVRRCLTFIDELREGVTASFALELLGEIVKVCIEMFGRNKVLKTLNKQIMIEEQKNDVLKQIEAGICVECGLNPITPQFPVCESCHDNFYRKEMRAEFDDLNSGDVTHH